MNQNIFELLSKELVIFKNVTVRDWTEVTCDKMTDMLYMLNDIKG